MGNAQSIAREFQVLISMSGIYMLLYSIVILYAGYRVAKSQHRVSDWFCALMGELRRSRTTYMAIALHILDQASDYEACAEYYREWQRGRNDDLNLQWWFLMSVAILVVHRIVSTLVIWLSTRNLTITTLQLLDLAMARAVWEGYLSYRHRPGNMQRLLQSVEAIFESFPQLVLSIVYLLRTQKATAPIIIQALFSIFTLSLRVCSDDADFFPVEFAQARCACGWPCASPLWISRIFLFRLPEISQRVCVVSLFWAIVGGEYLVPFIVADFVICKLISQHITKRSLFSHLLSPDFYTYLLYYKPGIDAFEMWSFVRPSLSGFYLFGLLVVGLVPTFQPGTVDNPRGIVTSPFGIIVMFNALLASAMPPCFVWLIESTDDEVRSQLFDQPVKFDARRLLSKVNTKRNLSSMIKQKQWPFVAEMVRFGADPEYVLHRVGEPGLAMLLLDGCKPMMKLVQSFEAGAINEDDMVHISIMEEVDSMEEEQQSGCLDFNVGDCLLDCVQGCCCFAKSLDPIRDSVHIANYHAIGQAVQSLNDEDTGMSEERVRMVRHLLVEAMDKAMLDERVSFPLTWARHVGRVPNCVFYNLIDSMQRISPLKCSVLFSFVVRGKTKVRMSWIEDRPYSLTMPHGQVIEHKVFLHVWFTLLCLRKKNELKRKHWADLILGVSPQQWLAVFDHELWLSEWSGLLDMNDNETRRDAIIEVFSPFITKKVRQYRGDIGDFFRKWKMPVTDVGRLSSLLKGMYLLFERNRCQKCLARLCDLWTELISALHFRMQIPLNISECNSEKFDVLLYRMITLTRWTDLITDVKSDNQARMEEEEPVDPAELILDDSDEVMVDSAVISRHSALLEYSVKGLKSPFLFITNSQIQNIDSFPPPFEPIIDWFRVIFLLVCASSDELWDSRQDWILAAYAVPPDCWIDFVKHDKFTVQKAMINDLQMEFDANPPLNRAIPLSLWAGHSASVGLRSSPSAGVYGLVEYKQGIHNDGGMTDQSTVDSLCILAKGSECISQSDVDRVKWRMENNSGTKELRFEDVSEPMVKLLVCGEKESKLVGCSESGWVYLWSISDGSLKTKFPLKTEVSSPVIDEANESEIPPGLDGLAVSIIGHVSSPSVSRVSLREDDDDLVQPRPKPGHSKKSSLSAKKGGKGSSFNLMGHRRQRSSVIKKQQSMIQRNQKMSTIVVDMVRDPKSKDRVLILFKNGDVLEWHITENVVIDSSVYCKQHDCASKMIAFNQQPKDTSITDDLQIGIVFRDGSRNDETYLRVSPVIDISMVTSLSSMNLTGVVDMKKQERVIRLLNSEEIEQTHKSRRSTNMKLANVSRIFTQDTQSVFIRTNRIETWMAVAFRGNPSIQIFDLPAFSLSEGLLLSRWRSEESVCSLCFSEFDFDVLIVGTETGVYVRSVIDAERIVARVNLMQPVTSVECWPGRRNHVILGLEDGGMAVWDFTPSDQL